MDQQRGGRCVRHPAVLSGAALAVPVLKKGEKYGLGTNGLTTGEERIPPPKISRLRDGTVLRMSMVSVKCKQHLGKNYFS